VRLEPISTQASLQSSDLLRATSQKKQSITIRRSANGTASGFIKCISALSSFRYSSLT